MTLSKRQDDMPLRVALLSQPICASARRALHSGHHFVFDEKSTEVVWSVCKFLDDESQHGYHYEEFALHPYRAMGITFFRDGGEDGGEFVFLMEKGAVSCYLRKPDGSVGVCYEDYGPDDGVDYLRTQANQLLHLALCACLLILNQPASLLISEVPAARRFVRGKIRAFAAHHVVSIKLDRQRLVRLIKGAASGIKQRRHERRGHFAHKGGDGFSCIHEWVHEDCATNDHWRCSLCGRLRFWIKTYEAGDAGIGYVTKLYDVSAGRSSTMMGRAAE